MDIQLVKKFLWSCQEAKRITETFPKLPDGLSPRHIRVLETIYELNEKAPPIKVSDVSDHLRATRPSITKLIHELEAAAAVCKNPSDSDRRMIFVSLTEKGNQYYDIYVKKHHTQISEMLADMDECDIATAIKVIHEAYKHFTSPADRKKL